MIQPIEEASRCLLCHDAPCTKACPAGNDPARGIRAIRFGNPELAGLYFSKETCAKDGQGKCEEACIHYDRPIRIRELAAGIESLAKAPEADLSIEFCGIRCENPFFLASSAVDTNYDMVSRALEAGWAGVFYKTICLQEINEVSPRFDAVRSDDGHFAGFRNMEQLSETPPEMDFEILHRLKENYPGKVIIASIMGKDREEWSKLAKMAEAAGVDAVELNFSCPQMTHEGMGSDVGQTPELVAEYTLCVKKSVSIPVIPKMTPNVTKMSVPAKAACLTGANAISAINTIKSVTMSEGSAVAGMKTVSGYSGKAVKPIALRYILEMTTDPLLKTLQFSGVGGIETWQDALEFIQLGCRTLQVCTAVMQYGYRIIEDLTSGLKAYMAGRGIQHLQELVGEQLPRFTQPEALERNTMVYPVIDRQKCIGCGRCYISCQDGGHQAIVFGEDRQPKIQGQKCVGCHLCRLVCPTGAIGIAKRIPKVNRN